MTKYNTEYFKSLVFGAEDSLVSTLGVLFGVASANMSKRSILVTGLIIISVEAISMGVGSFLTETSAHEVNGVDNADKPSMDGLIMFTSYFLFGFVPLVPYILFSAPIAKFVSLVITLITLFLIGFLPTKKLKAGFRMAFLAGIAVVVGFSIGRLGELN